MTIEWNKVTWYSKLLAVIIFVATFYIGFQLGEKKAQILPPVEKEQSASPASNAITITKQNIKEENFSGSMPVISGGSPLALLARTYINETISNFRKQANTDVPDMRKHFGADAPPATYTIDIGAKDVKGNATESIVIDMYAYTGGANGNSSYKVFTANRTSGQILSLADIIKSDEQNAFTEFLKNKLNTWAPEGSTAPVVFPEDVNALTFASFTNWSLDNTNLVIYFDKYAIGPGVLGAVAFPIPLKEIKNFLK